MNRFVALLAVAIVAGAMYVAAAPGSRQAAGPTAKQFAALKKQVTKLEKQVKSAKTEATAVAAVMLQCLLHQTVGVSQNGDPGGTYGYSYTANGTTTLTTALDLNSSAPAYTLLTLNTDPSLGCSSLVGLGGAQHFAHVAATAGH